MDVKKAITVCRSPEEVYRFWHDFENLPCFMKHLESVQVTGERGSHWKARAPFGPPVEWDAEITEDRFGECIAWRSLPGAEVETAGRVTFMKAPGDRGTEIHVDLSYNPPAGRLGAAIARLYGENPEQQVGEDLRRFKQILETGEILVSEGSLAREEGLQVIDEPAQPPERVLVAA